MLAGLILGATIVTALFLLVQLLQAPRGRSRNPYGFSAVGLLVAGVIVAVVLNAQSVAPSAVSQTTESGNSLVEMARISAGLRGKTPVADPQTTVASVPSLIDGLEGRLSSNPSDARGWALLAQSYAFIGRTESAEQALLRAVELGLDEADLRSRVASAERSPHTATAGAASIR